VLLLSRRQTIQNDVNERIGLLSSGETGLGRQKPTFPE
jgi:hypothetical protein